MVIFLYTFVLMASSGTLQRDEVNDRYVYMPNGAMTFVLWWNLFMMIWTLLFNLACQQMVISGAVSTLLKMPNQTQSKLYWECPI